MNFYAARLYKLHLSSGSEDLWMIIFFHLQREVWSTNNVELISNWKAQHGIK